MSKLHDFAQAVGADIKEIKTALAGKKEIADKISAAGGNTDSGIISKMTELGTRIDTIEQEDLVSVYNTAKA